MAKTYKKKYKKDPNEKSVAEKTLDKLFDYLSNPKDFVSEENEEEVRFYKSKIKITPRNFITNTTYSGLNTLILDEACESNDTNVPIFATYKQMEEYCNKHPELLREKSDSFDPEKPLKGLKASAPVMKWNKTYIENGKTVRDKYMIEQLDRLSFLELTNNNITKLQGMTTAGFVFAIEDMKHVFKDEFFDNNQYFLEAKRLSEIKMDSAKEDELFLKKAQLFIESSGVEVIEKEDSNRCYFHPSYNHIVIPPRDRFSSDQARMAIVLHELSHSTGHESRLNRGFDGIGTKESVEYSKEELIAELSTAMLCQEHGLKTFTSHAKYLKGYAETVCPSDSKKALAGIATKAKSASVFLTEKYNNHLLELDNNLENKLTENFVIGSTVLRGNEIIQEVSLKGDSRKSFTVVSNTTEVDTVAIYQESALKDFVSDQIDLGKTDKNQREFIAELKQDFADRAFYKLETKKDELYKEMFEHKKEIKNENKLENKQEVKSKSKLSM